MDWGFCLATLNASLNGFSFLLLLMGWRAIRVQKKEWHKIFMSSAFVVSILFLVSYLIRVFLTGTHRYPGEGFLKTFYLIILFSHILLAATVPFLAVRTIYLAIKNRFTSHKKIARWTLPIWMYVSLTGVAIYLMLYHWV